MRQRGIAALCTALIVGAGCAHAPPSDPAPAPGLDLAHLEDIFWTCDYVATTQGVGATPARECAAATRELRRIKFDNSFQRMLEWWREHKPAEHGKRRRLRNDPEL